MKNEKELTELEAQMQDAYSKFAMLLTRHAAMTTDKTEFEYHKAIVEANNGGNYMIGMFHVSGPVVSLVPPQPEKVD